jgi:hypothetical protein
METVEATKTISLAKQEIANSIRDLAVIEGFKMAKILWELHDDYHLADRDAERLFFFKQGILEIDPLAFEDME